MSEVVDPYEGGRVKRPCDMAFEKAYEYNNPLPPESGWLIDDTEKQCCLGSIPTGFVWVSYTDPLAVRFARKEDAHRMAKTLYALSSGRGFAGHHISIVEHGWG